MEGYRLKNSVIKEVEVSGAIHCIQTCLTEGFPCKSINYGRISEAKGQCQLNSKRYEIFNPGLLVADKKSDFFQRSQVGLML